VKYRESVHIPVPAEMFAERCYNGHKVENFNTGVGAGTFPQESSDGQRKHEASGSFSWLEQ